MTIRHHPRDETLLAYAAGTLAPALSAVVACHLALCAKCRAETRRMEAIGGALLKAAAAAELSGKALDRAVSRAAQIPGGDEQREAKAPAAPTRPSILPQPLASHLRMGIDDIPWKQLTPGVEQFKIKTPRRGGDLRILRVQPGRKLLRHGHYGSELTLVLAGAYSDETGAYHAGEVVDLDETIEHRPRAIGDEPCICIIAGESHPRYKTFMLRLLRPFFGY
jgi:putative transcriptional regulator